MSNILKQRNINYSKSVAILTTRRLKDCILFILIKFTTFTFASLSLSLLEVRGKYIKDKAPRWYHGLAMLHSARARANK